MSSLFAAYATSTAFRVDLSKRMAQGLLQLASGRDFDTGHYGAQGLLNRGLVDVIPGQDDKFIKRLSITDAGMKVAELCEIAGLGSISRPASSKGE